MKFRNSFLAALAALALAAFAAPAASSGDPVNSYTVTALGSLGGGSIYAYGLNDAGQVVGVTGDAAGLRRAFVWEAGTMTDLGSIGGPHAAALAVNEPGQVVGWAQTAALDTQAFLWDPITGMRDLGTLGGSFSEATAINDAGQVVGSSRQAGGVLRACLWQNGAIRDLGTLSGYTHSAAYGIDGSGHIVGVAEDAAGNRRAFRWTPTAPNGASGSMVALHPTAGNGAQSLNDLAETVGWCLTSGASLPFLWNGTGGQALPLLPPGWNGNGYYTYAAEGIGLAINGSQTVVGENTVYIDYGEWGYEVGYQAFVWDSANGTRRLSDRIDGFGELNTARGVNGSGQIAANGPDAGYLLTPSAIPLRPASLWATGGDGRVTLGWSASLGATGYQVKRSDNWAGPYVPLAGAAGTTFTDTTVVNGNTYYYVVSAVNAWGESANSYAAQARPVPAPVAPAGLTAVGGAQMVSLTWSSSAWADYYVLGRATVAGGPYFWFSYTYDPFFDDYGDGWDGGWAPLENGVTYYYVVYAVNMSGDSGISDEASATPVAPPPPPAPTGLAATPGDRQVTLTWNASPGASYYNLWRATAAGGPYTHHVTNTGGTTWTDSGLVNGTSYYYVVTAVNNGGESPNSTEVAGTPVGPPPPAPPTALIATGAKRKVTLKWKQSVSSGITENRVYRADTSGGPYYLVAYLGPATSFTDSGLPSKVTFHYVVTAVRNGSEGGHSNQASAKTR